MPKPKEVYYIYQSLHQCELVLKPNRKVFAKNGADVVVTKRIALRFGDDRTAHVNAELVEDSPYTVEEIKTAVERTPNFRLGEIRLIYDSTTGEPEPEITSVNRELPIETGAAGLGVRAK